MIAIKKIQFIITLYLVITVFLTGCMVGPDFKKPEMEILGDPKTRLAAC